GRRASRLRAALTPPRRCASGLPPPQPFDREGAMPCRCRRVHEAAPSGPDVVARSAQDPERGGTWGWGMLWPWRCCGRLFAPRSATTLPTSATREPTMKATTRDAYAHRVDAV